MNLAHSARSITLHPRPRQTCTQLYTRLIVEGARKDTRPGDTGHCSGIQRGSRISAHILTVMSGSHTASASHTLHLQSFIQYVYHELRGTAVASGRVVCTIGTQCTQPRVERQLKFMAVRDYLLVYLRYCLLPTAYCLLNCLLPILPILPTAGCLYCRLPTAVAASLLPTTTILRLLTTHLLLTYYLLPTTTY